MVCIVLKNMGENLRKIAMHITNEFVSQAVDQNFHEMCIRDRYGRHFPKLAALTSFLPFCCGRV